MKVITETPDTLTLEFAKVEVDYLRQLVICDYYQTRDSDKPMPDLAKSVFTFFLGVLK